MLNLLPSECECFILTHIGLHRRGCGLLLGLQSEGNKVELRAGTSRSVFPNQEILIISTYWITATAKLLSSFSTLNFPLLILALYFRFKSWSSSDLWRRVMIVGYQRFGGLCWFHPQGEVRMGAADFCQTLISYHITKRRQNPVACDLNLPWKPQISYFC